MRTQHDSQQGKIMQVSKVLAVAVVAAMSVSTLALARSRSPTLREQQEAACSNDAITLCREEVPDEAKVTVCMEQKFSQLSPACAKMFESSTHGKKRR